MEPDQRTMTPRQPAFAAPHRSRSEGPDQGQHCWPQPRPAAPGPPCPCQGATWRVLARRAAAAAWSPGAAQRRCRLSRTRQNRPAARKRARCREDARRDDGCPPGGRNEPPRRNHPMCAVDYQREAWCPVGSAVVRAVWLVRPTARRDPYDGGQPGWRGPRGCASAGGTHGSWLGDGCSAGRCACSRLSLHCLGLQLKLLIPRTALRAPRPPSRRTSGAASREARQHETAGIRRMDSRVRTAGHEGQTQRALECRLARRAAWR